MKQNGLLVCVFFLGLNVSAYAQIGGEKKVSKRIEELLQNKNIRGAKVSILLKHLPSQRIIYQKNKDLRLHPASNTKIITTATALNLLGPNYRWSTDLVTDSFRDGIAKNLYFVGRGDPYFVSESLWKLIDDAQHNGLKKIDGDIFIDASRFTERRLAPGFEEKDQDSAYRAASGAASLNFNSVTIHIRPGLRPGDPPRMTFKPPSEHVRVVNHAITARKGRESLSLKASSFENRTQITLKGRIPIRHGGIVVRRRIDNPAQYLGDSLIHYLKKRGVEVSGHLKFSKAPPKHRRLARLYSRPLREIISYVNKTSNNFMAEQLVLTIGSEKGSDGNWKSGTKVVSDFLKKSWNLDGFSYVNGSGLFGQTAFSAQDFVTVLEKMNSQKPPMFEFINSLAVSRVDGTLKRRMKALKPGQVRAKTGTLDGVICLSGYLWFADGSQGAFSLLMNDFKAAPWLVWSVHDKIIQTMAEYNPTEKTAKKTSHSR